MGAVAGRCTVSALYGELPVQTVLRVDPLPLDETGRHVFPRLIVDLGYRIKYL